MQKWIMYHEVHKQHREGLKPAQIAKELVMDRRTATKYMIMPKQIRSKKFNTNQTIYL